MTKVPRKSFFIKKLCCQWDGNPVKLDCYDHYTTKKKKVMLSFGLAYIYDISDGSNKLRIFLFLFIAAPLAYESSQARGQIGAVTASLCHSHRNAGSKPRW